jgi:hypothetical protein
LLKQHSAVRLVGLPPPGAIRPQALDPSTTPPSTIDGTGVAIATPHMPDFVKFFPTSFDFPARGARSEMREATLPAHEK